MLSHLLSQCPPGGMSPDLLAACCVLESSLAAHEDLSDQLLLHVTAAPSRN